MTSTKRKCKKKKIFSKKSLLQAEWKQIKDLQSLNDVKTCNFSKTMLMIRYLYEIVHFYLFFFLIFFLPFFYEVYSRIYFCPLQLTYSYATMVSVKSLGTTYEGRQINMVTVSLNPSSAKSTKPAIFLECGIHAREWVSPATCLYAIDELIGSGQNGLLRQCKYSAEISQFFYHLDFTWNWFCWLWLREICRFLQF